MTETGAIVYPPVPAFYRKPQNLTEMVDHSLGRVLDLFGLDLDIVRRWNGGGQKRRIRLIVEMHGQLKGRYED